MPGSHVKLSQLDRSIKAAVLSLPSLVLAGLMSLFIALFTPGGLYERFDLLPRIGIVFLSTAVFIFWAHRVLPRAIFFALENRWPIVLVQTLVFIPPSLPFLFVVAGPSFTPADLAWFVAAAIAVIAITCIVAVLLFQTLVLPKTDFGVGSDELWSFGHPKLPETAPKELVGVTRMEAENQYTRVYTNEGSSLVTMTLGQAEAMTEPGAGLRVHRSHWVAFDQMWRIGYKNGNPRITTRSGESVPVSRSKVGAVRQQVDKSAAK